MIQNWQTRESFVPKPLLSFEPGTVVVSIYVLISPLTVYPSCTGTNLKYADKQQPTFNYPPYFGGYKRQTGKHVGNRYQQLCTGDSARGKGAQETHFPCNSDFFHFHALQILDFDFGADDRSPEFEIIANGRYSEYKLFWTK